MTGKGSGKAQKLTHDVIFVWVRVVVVSMGVTMKHAFFFAVSFLVTLFTASFSMAITVPGTAYLYEFDVVTSHMYIEDLSRSGDDAGLSGPLRNTPDGDHLLPTLHRLGDIYNQTGERTRLKVSPEKFSNDAYPDGFSYKYRIDCLGGLLCLDGAFLEPIYNGLPRSLPRYLDYRGSGFDPLKNLRSYTFGDVVWGAIFDDLGGGEIRWDDDYWSDTSWVIDGISYDGGPQYATFTLDNVLISAVPLPATLPMLAAGMMGFGFWRRRQQFKP